MKEKVKKRDPKSKDDLWRMTKEEFEAIPNSTNAKLYESLSRGTKAVLTSRGGNTKSLFQY